LLPFGAKLLFATTTAKNSFAPNGSNSFQSTQRVATGSNGRNALLEAVRAAHSTLTRYEIKHVNQGRIIYLRINGAEPTDTINFKDFQSGNEYSVRMVQQANSSGASFHIRGTITFADGRQRSFTVGLPDYYRPNVSHYTLSQIILSPNNRGHIFVIKQ